MINLKHVVTFQSIAQQGSFSRAAETLDLAQPTVSLHIKTLESTLGYALFSRVGKYAIMTELGKQFLIKANEFVRLAKEMQALDSAGTRLTGAVTLCIVQSVCTYRLPTILREFNLQFPNVQVSILVSRPSTYMLEQLRSGEFDAAIVLEAPFNIPSLTSKALWKDELQIVAFPGHPLTKQQPVAWEQLEHETFVLPEKGAHYRKLFERRLQEVGVTSHAIFEIHSLEAIKQCVMAEVGLAVLPASSISAEIHSGQLIPLTLQGRKLSVTAQFIWHSERALSSAAQAFVELVVDHYHDSGT